MANMRLWALGASVVVLALVVATTDVAARRAVPAVTMTQLGSLAGPHGSSFAYAINDRGQIVGASSTTDFSEHAFLWTEEGGMEDIGEFGPIDINDRGEVIGFRSSDWHAVKWTRKTGVVDLGFGVAEAINNAGTIAGVCPTNPYNFEGARACINRRGRTTGLGTLGGAWSRPFAISSQGIVVGLSPDTNGVVRPFIWTRDDRMRRLPGLIDAADINARRQIAGSVANEDGLQQAAVLRGGKVSVLGSLVGPAGWSAAVAINERGQVAGNSDSFAGWGHAFAWIEADGMIDLGSLGESSQAFDMNNNGEIAGWSSDGAAGRAVRWQVR